MSRFVKVNESVPIFLQLDKADAAQFPQATIVNKAGAVIITIDLAAISGVDGKYLSTYTFVDVGDYSIKFTVYSDAGHTTPNPQFRLGDETIRVTNLEDNVDQILLGNIGIPVAKFDATGQAENREESTQGVPIALDIELHKFEGGPTADDDNYLLNGSLPTVRIYNPSNTVVADSSQTGSTQPIRVITGQYKYTYQVGLADAVSDKWKIEWNVTVNGTNATFSELFTIKTAGGVVFTGDDFRVGFAFNNPDLTNTHHTTIYDPVDEVQKGWGLLVAPDELRYIQGFGTKLVSPDASQTFDDNMLQYYIDNALAMVERDLNIDLLPRVVRHENPINIQNSSQSGGSLAGESAPIRLQGDTIDRVDLPPDDQEPNRVREGGYPYRRNPASNYFYVKLKRRPLIDCLKAVLVDPIQNTNIDLYSWRKEHKGFESALQFFPNLTSSGNYPFLAGNLGRVRYPFQNMPDAMFFDYRTGYFNAADVPKEFRSVVTWVAAIPFLLDLGRGKSPGLSSASVNLNSISESFGTTQSATSTLYGADIITIQKQLETWYKRNAKKYQRAVIGVL